MTQPRTDNGEAMGRGLKEIRKPMQEIRAWKLSNGAVHMTKLEAVLAVLGNRTTSEMRHALEPDMPPKISQVELADAIIWFADEIRKAQVKWRKQK